MLVLLRNWVKKFFTSPEVVPSAIEFPIQPSLAAEKRYKRVFIPLHSGPGDPPPGFWKQCSPFTVHRFKAEFTCPFGHGMTLKGHAIAPNGFVSPSVVCHKNNCEFHEYVALIGWNQGHIRTSSK